MKKLMVDSVKLNDKKKEITCDEIESMGRTLEIVRKKTTRHLFTDRTCAELFPMKYASFFSSSTQHRKESL